MPEENQNQNQTSSPETKPPVQARLVALSMAPATLPGVDPELDAEIDAQIDAIMTYAPWNEEQQAAGTAVREALKVALHAIVHYVPSSPTRTVCIRQLLEVRMNANMAITFHGRV